MPQSIRRRFWLNLHMQRLKEGEGVWFQHGCFFGSCTTESATEGISPSFSFIFFSLSKYEAWFKHNHYFG
ncbi:hypothetical protein Bca4012_053368 [Brassica carinata]